MCVYESQTTSMVLLGGKSVDMKTALLWCFCVIREWMLDPQNLGVVVFDGCQSGETRETD